MNELLMKGTINELLMKGTMNELLMKGTINELLMKGTINELLMKGTINELLMKGSINELLMNYYFGTIASFKNLCGISRFTTNSTHLLHIFNQIIIICMIAYDMFHITDIKCSPQEKTFLKHLIEPVGLRR